MSTIKSIEFALATIKTKQFAIIEDEFSDEGIFNVQSTLDFKGHVRDQLISISGLFLMKSQQRPFLIIEVETFFKILHESWDQIFSSTNNSITIPNDFGVYLAGISVGITRGILHAKTEGHQFNKYFLPLIDLTQFLKGDITLSASKLGE